LLVVGRFTPLAEYLTPRSLASWARVLRQSTWAPIALVMSFIPAAFIMFPLPLLILIAVLAFGRGPACRMASRALRPPSQPLTARAA